MIKRNNTTEHVPKEKKRYEKMCFKVKQFVTSYTTSAHATSAHQRCAQVARACACDAILKKQKQRNQDLLGCCTTKGCAKGKQ